MAAEEPRPRREVVTGPRARQVPPARTPHPVRPEPAAADPAVSALIRRQLRAALTAAGALVLLLGSLPLLLALAPGLAAVRIAGVHLVWPLLGVVVYPVLWLIGRWYVRRTERNESAP